MNLSDFEFELPDELIARFPLEVRSHSRLLHLDRASGEIAHRRFGDLVELLRAGDLLVFNDTRVIPARLYGTKDSGGRVELLVTRILDSVNALAMIRSSKPCRAGSSILLDRGDGDATASITIVERQAELYHVRFPEPGVMPLLASHGHVPLPPYIDREDVALDRERYQTVFARRDGAVAAPTAGLHFDDELLDSLAEAGVESGFVTLHVGAGTFQPVRVDRIEEHRMHSEHAEIPQALCDQVGACRARGGRVVAVGTTSVRCLETAAAGGTLAPYEGETDLFIYPGYDFRCVDALLTNFHLPGSTLIMLVSAFCGTRELKRAYGVAIEERYRFFSYGDAMLIT